MIRPPPHLGGRPIRPVAQRIDPGREQQRLANRHHLGREPLLGRLAPECREIRPDHHAGHDLRTVWAIGAAFPLTIPANGRACLAALTDQHMLQLATAEWAQHGRTVNLPQFLTLIGQIRLTGIAQDLDAHTTGISAVGISFADGTDHYAISVPIPSSRFAEKLEIVTQALLDLKSRL